MVDEEEEDIRHRSKGNMAVINEFIWARMLIQLLHTALLKQQ